MKAMILAAGRGDRMRPLTDHTPKPLLEVGGKPLIVWHIENLKKAGFEDIVINIAWLGDKIPAVLGDGSKFGVNLHYSDEQQEGALETAGGIIKALPLLCEELDDEPFLVVNGDVWCNFPYSNISPLPKDGLGDLAHLVLVNNPEHNPKGDFDLNDTRLNQSGDNKFTFSGIGYYHPDLFKNLEQGKRPLAPLLREKMRENLISGELYTGDWRDIGTPTRLKKLDRALLRTSN
ncbi:MAG: nucleotidyltransferase family protein [Cocleimonas sp.]